VRSKGQKVEGHGHDLRYLSTTAFSVKFYLVYYLVFPKTIS